MPVDSLNGAVRLLKRAALTLHGDPVSDGYLLTLFLERRDETAFEVLLRRHGPMVLGVCRRWLPNAHDAEDAFQATFLILVRKAGSIVPRDHVGNWLYGVAFRTARKARAQIARRSTRQRRLIDVPAPEEPVHTVGVEWRMLLDKEVSRLPDRYRAPVVLCDLEGRSRKEAARRLQLPEGTISSRLARAREKLARRLAHQAPFLSPGIAALRASTWVSPVREPLHEATRRVALSATASGPIFQMTSTIRFARERIVMVMSNWKTLAAMGLGACVLGLAVGTWTPSMGGDKPDSPPSGKPASKAAPQISATLKSVAADRRSITVTLPGVKGSKEPTEKTLELNPTAKVMRTDHRTKVDPGVEGSLADLVPGAPVIVDLSPDGKTATRLVISPRSYQGYVKSLDVSQRALTIRYKRANGQEEKTWTLPEGTKILLNDGLEKGIKDKDGTNANLAPGTPVDVRSSAVDPRNALSVRVLHRSLSGTLKGVDVGGQTITITVKEDAEISDKTLRIVKGAHIEGKLGDLVVGTTVQVSLSVFDPENVVAIRKLED